MSTRIFLFNEPDGRLEDSDKKQILMGMSTNRRRRVGGRYAAGIKFNVTPSEWVVLDPGFNFVVSRFIPTVDMFIQFRSNGLWGDSREISARRMNRFSEEFVSNKVRVKSVTSTGSLIFFFKNEEF